MATNDIDFTDSVIELQYVGIYRYTLFAQQMACNRMHGIGEITIQINSTKYMRATRNHKGGNTGRVANNRHLLRKL